MTHDELKKISDKIILNSAYPRLPAADYIFCLYNDMDRLSTAELEFKMLKVRETATEQLNLILSDIQINKILLT